MLFIIWVVVLLVALVLYCRQVYSRFSQFGVKNIKVIPFFGNYTQITLRLEHFTEGIQRIYDTFPEERFVGSYEFLTPTILMRDIELLKQITVKDFEYFLDHRVEINKEIDPYFGRNLFALKGDEWKDMRSTLSPAFTSSKMRLMVPFMVEAGETMIQVIKKKITDSGANYFDIDTKDTASRFANDVIATCAFGLKVNSHTDDHNDFYKRGREASTFKFSHMMKFLGFMCFPNVMRRLKVSLLTEETKSFFKDLVLSTMKTREKNNIVRPDMIHLLMEVKKGTLLHEEKKRDADAGFATVEESTVGRKQVNRVWADYDLIAQAVVFFIAGFDAVSTATTFLLHELALNPEVQEKLVMEIQEHNKKHGGKFDYNSVQSLTYLDMVVSELMRLWPPAIFGDRLCTKDYNLGRPNDKATQDYIIRKGEGITIPTWCIHHDPKYFPEPFKFDPERFSVENRHKINPSTYMPFGAGPRNCIGSRFALCEIKVFIYLIVKHMELSPCEKTYIPVKLQRSSFNLRMQGGHCVRMKIRE